MLCRISLEQQTQEGAAKALAALRYEEQCAVQQLSEPATAISFLAHGTTDGVPLPDPGVAVLIVRSSCPSNSSLSVQVSSSILNTACPALLAGCCTVWQPICDCTHMLARAVMLYDGSFMHLPAGPEPQSHAAHSGPAAAAVICNGPRPFKCIDGRPCARLCIPS